MPQQTIPGAPTYGVPPSTIMGNLKPGPGPAQPISITDLAHAVAATGAVATSGAPAVTSGASATVTNANLTVVNGLVTAASSGSGGGGGLFGGILTSVPTQASTGLSTWINQGSATVADGPLGIDLTAPGSGTHNLRCIAKTAPTAPYIIKALISVSGAVTSNWSYAAIGHAAGLTTADKLDTHGLLFGGAAGGMERDYWTNVTTFSSAPSSTQPWYMNPRWVGIAITSTNIIYLASHDGRFWTQWASVPFSSSWLGAGNYKYVVFMSNNDTSAASNACLMYYAESSVAFTGNGFY